VSWSIYSATLGPLLKVTDFSFSHLTLVLPRLWEEPWEQYLSEAEGNARRVIEAQSIFARLLQGVAGETPSAELLAWLAIWSRFANALTALRGAVEWPNQLSGWTVVRAAFEIGLHLEGIQRPESDAGRDDRRDWELVRHRLRGYLAWSLWEERRHCKQAMDDNNLDALFDPRPARELIAHLGERNEAFERLTGAEVPLISDQESSLDRERMMGALSGRLARVDQWLGETSLQDWCSMLKRLENRTAGHAPGPVSIFELLGEKRSVSAVLKARGCAHLYPLYMRGSAAVHGAGLWTALHLVDGGVAPSMMTSSSDVDSYVQLVLSEVRTAGVALDVIASRLW